MDERVVWKLERSSYLLIERTRTWERLVRTKSWHFRRDLANKVSETTKYEKVSETERNEVAEMDRGSRSLLIVAMESRETYPREPVSSQGEGRETELPLGNTR
jgi:hypothetical protein